MALPLPFPGIWGSPLLGQARFDRRAGAGEAVASTRGALVKAAGLVALTGIVMATVWVYFYPAALARDRDVLRPLGSVAFACGMVAMSLVFVGRYKTAWLPLIAPAYAILAAVFLAGLSLGAESDFPGIALNTIVAVLGVFVVMAVGYRLRWFQPTARFRAMVFAMTAGIGLVYLVAFAMSLLGLSVPMIHDAGIGGILWTGFICTVAAMHLLIDFQRIEMLDRQHQSREMEWYAALALNVTLVWLYLFLLRLLQQLRR